MPVNFVPNPSFEYDPAGGQPAGWVSSPGWTLLVAGATMLVVSSHAKAGSHSLQVTTTAANAFEGVLADIGVLPPGNYVASAWIAGAAGGESVQLIAGWTTSTAKVTVATMRTSLQRVTVGFTVDPGAGSNPVRVEVSSATASAMTFFVDAVMVNAGTAALDYFDGDSPADYWTGTKGSSPSTTAAVAVVREFAPTRLSLNITAPDGHKARWGEDGTLGNQVKGLSFSTTMPGGFEHCSATLDRDPRRSYPDLARLADCQIRGAGGQLAWEGRMDTIPDTGGWDSHISPTFVGYQAHLQDDNSAKAIYFDQDLSQWQGASTLRRIAILNAAMGGVADLDDGSSQADPSTQLPSFVTGFQGHWDRWHLSEGWYDAQGIPIATLLYAYSRDQGGPQLISATPWTWTAYMSVDGAAMNDSATSYNVSSPATSSGTFNAGSTNRTFIGVQLQYNTPGGTEGVNYSLAWTFLGVVGRHGKPIQGASLFTGSAYTAAIAQSAQIGILASDVIAHAVATWAPLLNFTEGPLGTVRPSSFAIPQLTFKEPTTASAILQQAMASELFDWYVYDNRTFYFAPRDTFSREWRARLGDISLQETGPQSAKVFNGVIVSYNDVTGQTRTVGPIGSGANVEDGSLSDPDPLNPANEILTAPYTPMRKWGLLQMSMTSTSAGAIQIGQLWLHEQKQIDRSGSATINGHIQDESGTWWPAWMVRAGDILCVMDSHDTNYRRIVRTDYSHDSRSNSISLDQPPEYMAQLLERLQVSLLSLGA